VSGTLLDQLFPEGVPEQQAPEPTMQGERSTLLDRLGIGTSQEGLDRSPLGAATRDPRYQQLLRAMYMGSWAGTNPEIGDPQALEEQATRIGRELAEAYGLPMAHLSVRARGDLPTYAEAQGGGLPPGSHTPLAMNALGAVGSTFEPLQLLGDFTRTFTSNLAYVQGEREARKDYLEEGEITDPADPRYHAGAPAAHPLQALGEMGAAFGRTVQQLELDETSGWYTYLPSLTWSGRRIYGTSPYEEANAVRGTDLVRQFHLDERFGIDPENELAVEGLGLALEVLMDPYLAGDLLFGFSKGVRVIANRTGNASWARSATSLERTAAHVYRTLSPAGMIGDLDKLASGVSLGYWDDLKSIVARGINVFLDAPAPAGLMPQRARAALGVLGFPPEAGEQARAMAPRWRDVFLQSGTSEWLPGPLPKWMTGGEDYGLSEAERAVGYRNQIQSIGLRSVVEIGEALTDGLPRQPMQIRFPWARTAMPGARPVRGEYQGYVRGLNTAVRDWLDGASMYDNVRGNPKMMDRLADLSSVYNLPIDDTIRRFELASAAGRRAVLQIGYEVSGYRYYIEAMKRAANDLGYDYNDVRRAHEAVWTGQLDINRDMQTLEVSGLFPTIKRDPTTGLPLTGATAADPAAMTRADAIWQQWTANPSDYDAYVAAVERHLTDMGRASLHGITPERYLQGIQEGYLRRSFMGVREPDRAIRSVADHTIIPLREPNIAATVDIFRGEWGDTAADAAAAFLRGMTPMTPRGQPPDAVGALTFRAEDLAQVMTQRLGRTVTPREVSELVYRHDPNAIYLRETMDLLENYNVIQPDPGLGGSVYGQIPSTYTARQDLDPEHLARLIQHEDTTRQVAEMATRGGRQVGSQEFLGAAWDQLSADGLIRMRDEIRPSRSADVTAPLEPWIVDGVRYVAFPENPKVWGPFAGQAVPEQIARSLVQALAFQETGASSYERVLRMWRQMLISPLPTSLRNIIGNMILIQQAGGDMSAMLATMPRAHAFRQHFLDTGRLPDQFAGYEHMFQFVQDSTRTQQAVQTTAQLLDDVAKGTTTFDTILSGAEGIVDWATKSPVAGVATLGGTGALGLFRYGEEITRTSAFLTTYDALIAQGIDHAQAVNRAAHFASNAAYNYGALPLGPDLLRRTGASAFPQFAWFTAGRTARVIAENPAAPLRFEYLRRLANMTATEGDLTEQERLTLMISDWQRFGHPSVIPIPGEDGRYYSFDTQYFFPQGSNILDVFYDPFTLPALAPWIDAAYALVEGSSGTGPFSARYGLQVFDPAKDTPGRLADAAQFTVQSYLFPGVSRAAGQLGEMADYTGLPFGAFGYTGANEEALDLWALNQLRFVNADPAQFWARRFGLNLRKVSTDIADPSFTVAINKVDTEMGPAIASAREAWEQEVFLNGADTEKAKELEARYFEWENRAWERLQQLIDLIPED
jgi:hypothetical protein